MEPVKKNQISIAKFQSGIQLFLTITSVVIVVASLWLASLISPLKQDIAVLANQVENNRFNYNSLNGKVDKILIHFGIQN